MVQVMERTEGRYDLREVEFGKDDGHLPERVVLECDCRASLIFDAHVSVWRHQAERSSLECGICGESFVLTRMVTHRYSWLEDGLERLEGKEARHEYYARL